jgi:hypothetical protein
MSIKPVSSFGSSTSLGGNEIPFFFPERSIIRGYIQKFPDWPPGARTANVTALCHYVQLYRYFVSQSSEFCRHSPLKRSAMNNTKGKLIFRYDSVRKLLDTPSYTMIRSKEAATYIRTAFL